MLTWLQAGFPFFQLDRYLKILVQDLNRYVAIAEEFPNDPSDKVKAGGLMHDRRVSRIITPGTLIDENFMDPFSNNYVLAINTERYCGGSSDEQLALSQQQSLPIGLAWLDLSTGHFFTQSTTLSALPSFLARVSPTEIVLDEHLQASKDHGIFTVLAEDHHLITYTAPQPVKPISEWTPMLESPVSPRAIEEFTTQEVAAGSALLQYIEARLQGSNMKLQPPSRQLDMMGIDKNTMRALEIKKTMRDDALTGSLLHTIRRTVTKGGARLLDNWLSIFSSLLPQKLEADHTGSPSTSLSVINSRLDLVTHMLHNPLLRERITILLKHSHDSHRLLQKFAFGRGEPDDLLDLASTITATSDLISTLQSDSASTVEPCVNALIARISLKEPLALATRIRGAIDEEGVVQQHRMEDSEAEEMQALAMEIVSQEGTKEDSRILPKGARKKKATSLREHYFPDTLDAWIMRPAASPVLQRLHSHLSDLILEKKKLGKELCKKFGAESLTLKFTPGLGHICHLKGKDTKLDLGLRSLSASKSTRSFHHPSWSALGGKIDTCVLQIRNEETRVFHSLREEVILNIIKLRRNGAVLSELDVACSFAALAEEKNWVCPILNTSCAHKVIGGRHPTVEGGLESEGRSFITNDCFIGQTQPVYLITGPNMAGKSTYLRQNALITILAQIGSYVPASFAELGIVDAIFSRVGSADNLFRDQSTFMVEMLETARILREATKRSFVIMDEVGRGTTPGDGEAVAFACLWYLLNGARCRTLFATHFHGLAEWIQKEGMEGGVGFWCTDVKEDEVGEGFRYVHRLREGVNRRSHALKVARLAGLPKEAIDVARRVLEHGGKE
jgi:DNA mismatch repair ATPase MutS